MGVDHTFESKVMAVWICRGLPWSISRVMIYDAHESDIRVKSYSHLNFSRASVVQFWASRYIMGVYHTLESKVMAVWICRELPWAISRVSIYDADESDIRVKSYSHLNFSRASVVQFWVSQYIMGVDHTFESKVMAVWICRELPWSISKVSIYDARESDIRVKSYSHLNFSRVSVVQFWVSRYIMGVDHTFESKVMAVWIYRELPWSISRVSIYDARESDIRVKSHSHLNFWELQLFNFERLDISWASIIHSSQKFWPFEFAESIRGQFQGSRYMMHVNRTSEWKVIAI